MAMTRIIRAGLLAVLLAPLPACAPGDVGAGEGAVGASAEAGGVRIDVAVSPAAITVGRAFDLRITTSVGPDAGPAPRDLDVTFPERWVAEPDGEPVVTAGDDGLRAITRFRVEPYLPGTFEIGPVAIAYEGEPEPVLTVAAIPVEVLSAIPDPTDAEAAGIRGVFGLPPSRWWIAGAAVAALAAIAIAASAVLIARARAQRVVILRRTAHDVALASLDELLARDLLAQGRTKEFIAELSMILRRYIEHRFDLHAPERTTEEFLAEARRTRIFSDADVILLDRFLRQCDLVKFAGARLDPAQIDETVGTVTDFIGRTRISEEQVVVGQVRGDGRPVIEEVSAA